MHSTRLYEGFAPYLNIDFGGPDGSLISSLVRVVVNMSPFKMVTGLEFIYAGQDSKLYGKRGEFEQSLLVDGAHGERISDVEVKLSKRSAIIRSLKVG
jgi:hypothetical protein